MLRAPRSLFAQLVVSQALLMIAVGTILPILLTHILNDTADRFVTARLTRDAQAIAAGRAATGHEAGARVPGILYADPIRGRRFAVFDAGGRVVRQGPFALPLPLAKLDHGTRPMFFRRGPYDMVSFPVSDGRGHPRWVVVAQDRTVPDEVVDDVVATFLWRFVWIVPVALFASLIVELAVMRSVTGRFRRTALQADAIGLHRIDARLRPADVPAEAVPLVLATNRALDRLEAGYRFQGEFVGNVAHELRTPLALISLRTEGLDPSPERDLILIGVEQANHVVRQLMALTAIDRDCPETEDFDPCPLVTDIVGTMAPLVFRADHDIAFNEPDRPPPLVRGVPGLVQIALANLIDNAVRHTPAGCTITVSVADDGLIVVEDDGPGLAVDAADGHRRRYRREDTKRNDSAGLGFAIVQRIMTVCGGSLETGNAPGGGARCTIRLTSVPRPMPPVDT